MRPKKVSGRWGFRPLGRGDGGKRNLKLFLTSRHYAALASSTTAHRSSRNRPGSRDQLPITVRFCLPYACGSIVPSFHLTRYFPRHAFVPFHKYLRTVRSTHSGTPARTDAFQTNLRVPESLNSFNRSPLPTAIRYSSIPCMT